MFRLVLLYERTLNASKELIELPGLNQVVSTAREVKIKKDLPHFSFVEATLQPLSPN